MAGLHLTRPGMCIAGKWAWQVSVARGFSTARSPMARCPYQHLCKGYSNLHCDKGIRFLKPKLLNNLRHFTSVARPSNIYCGRSTKYFIQDKWKLLLGKGQIIRWNTTKSGNGKEVIKALPKSSDIKRLLSIAKPEKWRIAGINTITFHSQLFLLRRYVYICGQTL